MIIFVCACFVVFTLIIASIHISRSYEKEILGFVAIKAEYERFRENEGMDN